MKSKILRFSGILQVGQTDILTTSLQAALNKFLLGDVVVHHISQSSAILQTQSGLVAHISVCLLYEDRKSPVSPAPRSMGDSDPRFRELWDLLKRDCGSRAVVDRRVLRRRDHGEGFKRVQELISILTKNGDADKLFSLAMDFGTTAQVLKAYLK